MVISCGFLAKFTVTTLRKPKSKTELRAIAWRPVSSTALSQVPFELEGTIGIFLPRFLGCCLSSEVGGKVTVLTARLVSVGSPEKSP
uniref:Uncharacterized protein n=1 Tax=Solanum tuberosum TaxID=4113 RepID=M1DK19_SOLTU